MGRLPSRRWAAVRKQVLDRDGWSCQQCQKKGLLHVHHRQPIYAGGARYDPENLVTLCRGCHIDHHIKRRMPAEWRKLVRDTLTETSRKERNNNDPTTED